MQNQTAGMFFGCKDLKNYSYYYHLPKYTAQEKSILSQRIINLEGVRFIL